MVGENLWKTVLRSSLRSYLLKKPSRQIGISRYRKKILSEIYEWSYQFRWYRESDLVLYRMGSFCIIESITHRRKGEKDELEQSL